MVRKHPKEHPERLRSKPDRSKAGQIFHGTLQDPRVQKGPAREAPVVNLEGVQPVQLYVCTIFYAQCVYIYNPEYLLKNGPLFKKKSCRKPLNTGYIRI